MRKMSDCSKCGWEAEYCSNSSIKQQQKWHEIHCSNPKCNNTTSRHEKRDDAFKKWEFINSRSTKKKETKSLVEELKHYFSDVPLVMKAVEALEDKQETIDSFLKAKEMKDNHPLVKKFLSDWRKREGKNNLWYPDAYTVYEDFFALKEEFERVKKERDELAKQSEDPCTLCRHYIPCNGRNCPSFCEGVGDAEGKYPDWHWSCEDFTYGTCPILENTPCFECIQNGNKGFEWKEKEKKNESLEI